MVPESLFIRDPREVPFLNDQVKKVLALANQTLPRITSHETDDFGFMTIQFLCKQIQHAESVLTLVPRRDAGLIARTMIDGLYKLLWVSQAPEERARLWRSFSIITDWRLIQGRMGIGIPVDGEDIRRTEAALKALGDLHRRKKPRPNSSDPYNKFWYGDVKLSEMADLDNRELYDGPYTELSDWEHWGVSGIGDSIARQGSRIVVDSNSDRIAGHSLLAAFQCLLHTLAVTDAHLSLNIAGVIQNLGENFRKTLDSFYAK